jgi:RimJ/RimL family protein N-acetyltransferase
MLFEGKGPEVETGWCFAADTWGRGYAHESAAEWLRIAFEELGLDRVIAVILPGNERSLRLARGLGMREVGIRHAYGHDHVLLEIGRNEFSRG